MINDDLFDDEFEGEDEEEFFDGEFDFDDYPIDGVMSDLQERKYADAFGCR